MFTVCGPADVLKNGGEKLSPVSTGGVMSDGDEATDKIGLMPAARSWLGPREIAFVAKSVNWTFAMLQFPAGL